MSGDTPRTPPEQQNKPEDADGTLAFRRMWMGGVVGAYLVSLLRKLFVDLLGVHATTAEPHTLDLLIRYGYVLWFFAYFFVSHLRLTKKTQKWDVTFDVIQALVGFFVVFELGFFVEQQGFSFADQKWAVIVSDAGILAIALLALIWFPRPEVKLLRSVGAGVAAVSAVCAFFGLPVSVIGVLLVVLLVMLFLFARKRQRLPAAA